MPASTLNKHEQKTQETRRLLLAAAEKIFIRDGYEKADLGVIASEAGRTKGAIYGQFKSKEEVFLALYEAQALRYRAKMQELLSFSKSIEGNLTAMRKYVLEFATNDTWGLLLLEYRLFVVRHPEAKERLNQTYTSVVSADEEKRYVELLGPAPKGKGSISRSAAVHAMFATLSALQLESKFAPKAIGATEIRDIAAKVFDALFGYSK
ncbi:TetR family transcriptional regulator [Terriglobus sp. RCC_193]|uniref:TetR family transcriptional regulator n=1 Tax=Terriglobus sp. RCC_193 TaxID=3239218 RepID=UPI0035241282